MGDTVDHMGCNSPGIGAAEGSREVEGEDHEVVVAEAAEVVAGKVDLEELGRDRNQDPGEARSMQEVSQFIFHMPYINEALCSGRMISSEGRQRKYPHDFAHSEQVCEFTSEIFHHKNIRR